MPVTLPCVHSFFWHFPCCLVTAVQRYFYILVSQLDWASIPCSGIILQRVYRLKHACIVWCICESLNGGWGHLRCLCILCTCTLRLAGLFQKLCKTLTVDHCRLISVLGSCTLLLLKQMGISGFQLLACMKIKWCMCLQHCIIFS